MNLRGTNAKAKFFGKNISESPRKKTALCRETAVGSHWHCLRTELTLIMETRNRNARHLLVPAIILILTNLYRSIRTPCKRGMQLGDQFFFFLSCFLCIIIGSQNQLAALQEKKPLPTASSVPMPRNVKGMSWEKIAVTHHWQCELTLMTGTEVSRHQLARTYSCKSKWVTLSVSFVWLCHVV